MKYNAHFLLDFVFFSFGIILLILAYFPSSMTGLESAAACLLTAQLISLAWRSRRSPIMMLFLAFCMTYPVVFLFAKQLNVPYHYLTRFQVPQLEAILFANGVIFFSVFFFGIAGGRDASAFYRLHRGSLETSDSSLYYLSVGASLTLLVLGTLAAWPPQISGYSVDSRSSSLFEYAVIPAAIAALSARTRRERLILYALIFVGMTTPFLFARRGVSVIFFVLYVYLMSKPARNSFVVFAIVGVGLLAYRAFALFRADIDLSLASFVGAHLDGGLSNHQGGVIVSSVTYLGLIMEGYWDAYFRASSALGIFFAPFVPSFLNPYSEVFLNLEALKVASIPGSGGFPFVYLFVWGGAPLVILGAAAMRWIVFNRYSSPALKVAKLVLLISFPRWYAYSLPVGFKYVVISLLISMVLFAVRRKTA